jgi:hypothetical protein
MLSFVSVLRELMSDVLAAPLPKSRTGVERPPTRPNCTRASRRMRAPIPSRVTSRSRSIIAIYALGIAGVLFSTAWWEDRRRLLRRMGLVNLGSLSHEARIARWSSQGLGTR